MNSPAVRLIVAAVYWRSKASSNGFVARPCNVDHHAAIRGQSVTLHSDRAVPCGRHFQDVMIPLGLTLNILAVMKGGSVLRAGDVAVEIGIGCTRIFKTALDDDNAILGPDGHGAGLNDGLAGKAAPGGH